MSSLPDYYDRIIYRNTTPVAIETDLPGGIVALTILVRGRSSLWDIDTRKKHRIDIEIATKTGKARGLHHALDTEKTMTKEPEPKTMWRADIERGPVEVSVPPGYEGRYCSGPLDLIRDSEGECVWDNTHFDTKEEALDRALEIVLSICEDWPKRIERLEQSLEHAQWELRVHREMYEDLKGMKDEEGD